MKEDEPTAYPLLLGESRFFAEYSERDLKWTRCEALRYIKRRKFGTEND